MVRKMEVNLQSNFIFKPIHKSKQRYIVMKGSAGSGKSVDTAQQYILRLMAEKGRNLLCIRKSEVTNRDSTFSELIGAINRMGVSNAWKSTTNPLMIKCLNGNKVIFRGINHEKEREKLKSITFDKGKLTDVWIEEATELFQNDFEIVDDRLRGELPENQFYQIKMTFNPVNVSHWIKKAFFDSSDSNVMTHQSTYLDNRFVDEAYKQRMERRKEVDPDGYKIYGLGEWGEIGGLILHNWKIGNGESKDISQDLQHYDDITIGQDFGFNHANAILLLGFKDGNIYILREIYVHEKDTSEIIMLTNGILPKNKNMYCDCAEPDRIKMWNTAGYRAYPVEKEQGSVKAQIDWLKQHKIYVHSSCVNTIKELQQWKWKKDEKQNIYLDEPVNIFDDAMAALRYGIEGQRKPKGKTKILNKKAFGGLL